MNLTLLKRNEHVLQTPLLLLLFLLLPMLLSMLLLQFRTSLFAAVVPCGSFVVVEWVWIIGEECTADDKDPAVSARGTLATRASGRLLSTASSQLATMVFGAGFAAAGSFVWPGLGTVAGELGGQLAALAFAS